MTANMAGDLTDLPAEEILENLIRKNFFVEKRRGAASYQYHPLFREFLQITAERTYPASFLQELYLRAARILEKQGYAEEAIELYHKTGAHDKMAASLSLWLIPDCPGKI